MPKNPKYRAMSLYVRDSEVFSRMRENIQKEWFKTFGVNLSTADIVIEAMQLLGQKLYEKDSVIAEGKGIVESYYSRIGR